LEKQKFEKQKKAAALCQLWAERFGTWDVRPPETPKKVLRRFDVLRPSRTVQNESRQSAGLAKNSTLPVFKRETPRFCMAQKKSPTVTRSWHSLLGNYVQSAWQTPATFEIFVAENWVVIQVGGEIC
jgi:hypothetical protein